MLSIDLAVGNAQQTIHAFPSKFKFICQNQTPMRTAISYLIFAAVIFGIMTLAVIQFPSTYYILFGLCDSSKEYIAGECKVNTGNWGWCATAASVQKMRQSECTTRNGLIYFDEAQAHTARQRIIKESG